MSSSEKPTRLYREFVGRQDHLRGRGGRRGSKPRVEQSTCIPRIPLIPKQLHFGSCLHFPLSVLRYLAAGYPTLCYTGQGSDNAKTPRKTYKRVTVVRTMRPEVPVLASQCGKVETEPLDNIPPRASGQYRLSAWPRSNSKGPLGARICGGKWWTCVVEGHG